MTYEDTKRQKQRMQSNRDELVERMSRAISDDGSVEAFPGFFLARSSKPIESVQAVYQPAFCFVVQGVKRVLLGEELFRYDPGHFLIFTVDLPVVFQVEEASKEQPYLGFRLDLDPSLVAPVMIESGIKPKKGGAAVKAIDVSSINADMLDAIVRLVRLLDAPDERRFLAPLIIKEIVFRLLALGQGARLSHLLASAGDTRRISRAIGHLRENFRQPLRIDEIARELGMSISGFHLPLQVRYSDEPFAIPETDTTPGSTASDARRRPGRRQRRVPCGLRRSLVFQPRVQEALWRSAAT
jgi:hypothetical protein